MSVVAKLFYPAAMSCLVALGFSGCGGGNNNVNSTPQPVVPAETFTAGTYPRFDPVIADLPFNTDLIFAKAAVSDGTADVGEATDPVRAALNGLDGFSTSGYFDIMVEGSVDPASVLPMQTVFLLQLDTGANDALDPANIIKIKAPASFDAKVVSLDGGNNNVVRLRPTAPLKSKQKYFVFLTNGIKDAAGKPLTRSWSYNSLRDSTFTLTSSLVPVRKAILGWEKLAGSFLVVAGGGTLSDAAVAAASEKLVLSYTFTTTDPQAPLVAMAAPRAALVKSQVDAGVAGATAVANVSRLELGGLLPTPKARTLGISPVTGIDLGLLTGGKLAGNVGKLYTGFIKLPYYLTTPAGLPFGDFVKRSWAPDLTLATALSKTLPKDVDGTSYNLTYRYPFAQKKADESVPLQVTLPEKNWVPGYAGSATCGQVYAANGYPVVIYSHGITSDRTSVIGLAHTLASRCIATVAIDQPLHGIPADSNYLTVLNVEKSQQVPFAAIYGADAPHERHFNVAGAPGVPVPMNFDQPSVDNNDSGAQFINLGYMANMRDNNREAVVDLLNLNASLKNVNSQFMALDAIGAKLDLSRVYVVGHSLGAIIATVFTTVNQAAIASDTQAGFVTNLNPIQGLVASTPGTQVSQIIVNSPTFGPVIKKGLAASGVNQGTSSYEKFLYAAQSALDSADPVNFSPLLATLNVPVFTQQINNDQVIPNSVDSAPLAGTQPYVRLLGATQLGLGETQLGLGYVKLNGGVHSSLLIPSSETSAAIALTGEMQSHVVSFILNNGKVGVGGFAPTNVEAPQ